MFEVQRRWSQFQMQEFCKKYKFYTCGNSKDFEKLLDFVEANNPHPMGMYCAAVDILQHSNEDVRIPVSSLMFLLEREVVDVFYDVPDELPDAPMF